MTPEPAIENENPDDVFTADEAPSSIEVLDLAPAVDEPAEVAVITDVCGDQPPYEALQAAGALPVTPAPAPAHGEPVMYPEPAESAEVPSYLFTRVIWRAELDNDWYALSALRLAAERDLRERGIPQWTDTARGLDQMATYVNREEMYLVREGPSAVACFALSNKPDEDFWADDPERDECLYLQKVIAAPWARGTGLGRFIVNHAVAEADERCCSAVRLNCWEGNDKLRSHWESLGFTHLRTVEAPGRDSGVLMELRLVPSSSGKTERDE